MTKRLPAFVATRLLQILQSLPESSAYLVGFSGGADSTALLYALIELNGQLDRPVRAVHINHGIHKEADLWQEHCEDFCAGHSIELQCLAVNLSGCSGQGLEAEARQLRYQAISDLMAAGECLLTAHHADDQAETLLLNLMRGSGIDGLAAMPEHRTFGAGYLQRPLLGFQNSALLKYLSDKKIPWLEDPSNLSLNHDRNFIRHKVIPLLENRWTGINQRLSLTRTAMAESRFLLEPLANAYLDQYQQHDFVLQLSEQLDLSPALFNPALFNLVVRRWLKKSAAPPLPSRQLNSFCQQLQQPGKNHNTSIHWAGWSLRVYKQQLWLLATAEPEPCPGQVWPKDQYAVDLGAGSGKLIIEGPSLSRFPGHLTIANRQTHKNTTLKQGNHHKTLKNIFQSAGIPAWLRDAIPLSILDGELVAVGDWLLNDYFALWMSDNQASYSWQPENPLLQFIVKQQHSAPITGDG